MKNILFASSLILSMGMANAATITFNDLTTNTTTLTSPYTESGFSLTSTGFTTLLAIDADFNAFGSADGTDYLLLSGGGRSATLTKTGGGIFSLQSLVTKEIEQGADATTITLTGNLNGGGTLTESLTVTAWQTMTLPTTWENLDSVDIVGTGVGINSSFDNILVDEPAPVPVPAAVWLFASALASFRVFKKQRS